MKVATLVEFLFLLSKLDPEAEVCYIEDSANQESSIENVCYRAMQHQVILGNSLKYKHTIKEIDEHAQDFSYYKVEDD